MTINAFPGAYGWGARTFGGRGGRVIPVTNLNNSGAGSFRDAAESVGPRIIVFQVGGTLSISSEIDIKSYCTIAGQTAPGGGFCVHSSRDLQIIDAEQIIIRYLRVRSKGTTSDQDAFNMSDSRHIILDHCSIIWGTDESLGIAAPRPDPVNHITVQWCIIGDGADDTHNRPALIGRPANMGQISLHHNLILHGQERCPKFEAGPVDFVNNVVYNWQDACTQLHGKNYDYDVINNFYKAGNQSTNNNRREIYHNIGNNTRTYIAGNVGPSDPDGTPNWGTGLIRKPNGTIVDVDDPGFMPVRIAVPIEMAPIESAVAAYEAVLSDVGANRQLNADGTFREARDSADALLVGHVRSGTGDHIVDAISEHGGVPTLDPGTAYDDTDDDGMSDEWEDAQGLDKNDASDGPIPFSCSLYTNCERFING